MQQFQTHKTSKKFNYKTFLLSKEGVKFKKQTATTKFVESAEAHFNLNLDTKYSDQQLRTTISLPRGTGKDIKISILTSDTSNTDTLMQNGAAVVGSDDLIEDISKGNLDLIYC